MKQPIFSTLGVYVRAALFLSCLVRGGNGNEPHLKPHTDFQNEANAQLSFKKPNPDRLEKAFNGAPKIDPSGIMNASGLSVIFKTHKKKVDLLTKIMEKTPNGTHSDQMKESLKNDEDLLGKGVDQLYQSGDTESRVNLITTLATSLNDSGLVFPVLEAEVCRKASDLFNDDNLKTPQLFVKTMGPELALNFADSVQKMLAVENEQTGSKELSGKVSELHGWAETINNVRVSTIEGMELSKHPKTYNKKVNRGRKRLCSKAYYLLDKIQPVELWTPPNGDGFIPKLVQAIGPDAVLQFVDSVKKTMDSVTAKQWEALTADIKTHQPDVYILDLHAGMKSMLNVLEAKVNQLKSPEELFGSKTKD